MPPRSPFRNLPITRVLQLAFLLLAIVPGLVITAIAYFDSRQALRDEIRHRLHQDATVIAQELDAFLFERMENLLGWRRLKVMQDASIGDVDKRLSDFLAQLQSGYGGIYRELLVTDGKRRIVASSIPGRIGSSLDIRGDHVEKIRMQDGSIEVLPLQHPDSNETVLPMRIAVFSQFEPGPIGYLYALLDWRHVEGILDRVANENETDAFRFAILLNHHNRRIGHSREKGATREDEEAALLDFVQQRLAPAEEPPADGGQLREPGVFQVPESELPGRGLLVGYAVAPGFQDFSGLGWRTVVAESSETAFAPIRRLLWLLLAMLTAAVLVAILLSSWLSRAIAEPISRLADFSSRFDDTLSPDPPQVEGVREVQALNQAMGGMIERLRQSRVQLVHASKLAAVGELAANLAHEVRTPVGVLLSSSQLLKAEAGLSEQGRELVTFIGSESKRLNQLITLLLESGQPRAPVFEEMDLAHVLDECIGLLRSKATAAQVEIRQRIETGNTLISGDAGQLQQVFLNLLLNAIHFAPAGSAVLVTCHSAANGLAVHVEDGGPGIDEGDRERIFEPFFTRREGGFGLGLSIVQHIVTQHGGRITVSRGETLGGADFCVVLPRQHPRHAR